jgi:type III restriction enzyme
MKIRYDSNYTTIRQPAATLNNYMNPSFFEKPILNSPYALPLQHWELDDTRRNAKFISPIPKPRKRKSPKQGTLALGDEAGISMEKQRYDPTPIINELRFFVDLWRKLPNPSDWQVTPETARLLQHWRHHKFSGVRPFFCQLEAVETAIWLTEVAPKIDKGKRFLDHLKDANEEANPGLLRLALKLATGAGKTTVMAMIIAWQTVNNVRRPTSKYFTRGFLVVCPGLTIRDRLQVLQPNDPNSYYAKRELVPSDMLGDVARAKVVITKGGTYPAKLLYNELKMMACNKITLAIAAKLMDKNRVKGILCAHMAFSVRHQFWMAERDQ